MTRVAAVAAATDRAHDALSRLAGATTLSDPADCDVLVVLGGDGTLIDALRDLLRAGRGGDGPALYGANYGTTGFLLNDAPVEEVLDRVERAVPTPVTPLRFEVTAPDGSTTIGHAFNEVALRRSGSQVASLRVLVNGHERLAEVKGDGLLLSTAAGSTGYNQAAGGVVLPMDAGLVALTPICALRPRRWRGALLSRTDALRVEVRDPGKRPVSVSGDQRDLHPAHSVEVAEDPGQGVTLLFDPERTLHDRSLLEQFAP